MLIRVAVTVPHLSLCHVPRNIETHLTLIARAKEAGAKLVLFPELSLTGATCGDLFFQPTLLRAAREGLERLIRDMPEGVLAVVGAPLCEAGVTRNAAVLVERGKMRPVAYGPADPWFAAGEAPAAFALNGAEYAVSIGGMPAPDADVLLRMDATPEAVGQWALRRDALRRESAGRPVLYASAGWGESSADGIYMGHALIAAHGQVCGENPDFIRHSAQIVVDIDSDAPVEQPEQPAPPPCFAARQPFLPENAALRTQWCRDIFDMQGYGLARRLQITGGKVVVGISGGLDSTLALLAACRAMDILNLPRTNVLGVTMPCFGTTDWTYQSALDLMTTLGVTQREVRIHNSVRQHFRDIGHDEAIHDVTYENAQARERTQVLMDLSNQFGGIVLGTGDLSEIALGWCTYNGDHMSMYGVNAGLPKTVVRLVTETVSDLPDFAASHAVLHRILETPISPELLPPDLSGRIAQQTEDLVGPYALHDFFLYHAVREAREPHEIFKLCCEAFRGEYMPETIKKWLKNFYRRFFTQQFKRNCMPDGVDVGLLSLSPRGGWTMPSDGAAQVWLDACETLS